MNLQNREKKVECNVNNIEKESSVCEKGIITICEVVMQLLSTQMNTKNVFGCTHAGVVH